MLNETHCICIPGELPCMAIWAISTDLRLMARNILNKYIIGLIARNILNKYIIGLMARNILNKYIIGLIARNILNQYIIVFLGFENKSICIEHWAKLVHATTKKLIFFQLQTFKAGLSLYTFTPRSKIKCRPLLTKVVVAPIH